MNGKLHSQKYAMWFIDGNDPARAPGAAVAYPPLDRRMVYDPTTGQTVDTQSGDRFGLRISDPEYASFIAGIHRATDVVEIHGYIGKGIKNGFGETTAFNIVSISIDGAGDSLAVDKALMERIGHFLNAHPRSVRNSEHIGNVIVIDNRHFAGTQE